MIRQALGGAAFASILVSCDVWGGGVLADDASMTVAASAAPGTSTGADASAGAAVPSGVEASARHDFGSKEAEQSCEGVEAPPNMACIPGGEAVIGSDEHPNEAPRHTVVVSRFFIDRYEVTNAEYRRCERAGVCPVRKKLPKSYRPFLADDLPAIPISWSMAHKYCTFAGKRLPTEAEWEKVARGGAEARRFPWGDEPPTCDKANFRGCAPRITHAVGSLPPGPYGVHDMAGNGFEWVQDWASECYGNCPKACGDDCLGVDPQGPCGGGVSCESSKERVLKGGSWYWPADQMRGSFRRGQRPASGLHRLSFRCASDTPHLTRAPYWHTQPRPEPPPLTPPTENELAAFGDVRDDTDVMQIESCDKVGRATHACRDPMSYYKSNERDRGIFGEYIHNLGGGYVGLGADQAYDFISRAKSRWAWLFDYDPTVVRIHYAIRAVVQANETPQGFVDAFRPRHLKRTKTLIRASLAHRPEEIAPTLAMLDRYRGKLLYHYRTSLTPKRRFDGFGWLAHLSNYQHVRTMFLQGRILIRKGNLLTDVVLPDVAQSARALGVPVRVYYDSNAADQWELSERYRHNIGGLPYDEQSVVLRTLVGSRYKLTNKWLYVVHGGEHLAKTLARRDTQRLSHLLVDAQNTNLDYVKVIGLPHRGADLMLSSR